MFFSVFIKAQGNVKDANIFAQTNLTQLSKNLGVIQTFDDRYDGVKGNRFFYDDAFHDGEIWMSNDDHFKSELKYRFDQILGTVEVKYSDGKQVVLKSDDISTFNLQIGAKKIIFARFKMPEKNEKHKLLQVIYLSPTLVFLRDSKKTLRRVNDTGAYSRGKVYDEIEEDYHYFLSKDRSVLIEVKPTRKSFIKALPDREKKIEKLFNMPKYKKELTISLIAELLKELDSDINSGEQKK